MRWSSFVKVGLSGTSLALAMGAVGATGCSGENAEKGVALETYDERAFDEANAIVDRKAEQREREARRNERADFDAQIAAEAPWFLRPAGDTRLTSAQNPSPSEGNPAVRSDPPRQTLVKPVQPRPVQPVQATNKRPPRGLGWRAACGRG